MVQNSYTILTAFIIFIISLISFIIGLIKKNKVMWIPALILGLISGGYVLIMFSIGLSGGM